MSCSLKGSKNPAYYHGHTLKGRISPTWSSWISMRQRCSYPKDKCFHSYGGRGISVCERWQDFSNFLKDMGPRPDGKVLDRIDVNRNYEPDNCRWVTGLESARNKRAMIKVTIDGETKCLSEWCEILSLNYQAVHKRIKKYKWAPSKALSLPIRKKIKTNLKGKAE